jgi:hypothetical protein
MSVEGAGIRNRAKFGRDIHLSLVPIEAPGTIVLRIGGEITFDGPQSSGSDEQVKAERSRVPAGGAGIKAHIVSDRELEHIQAEGTCGVEKMELLVRPPIGKQVALSAVFH